MKHPHVEITDSTSSPLSFKHVYCHDKPAPPRGGFQAGTIERYRGLWTFYISPAASALDDEDRANLYIAVDEHIVLLNITDRLLK